ncbi:MAG: alpha/beta hydrolase [Proteobacteria bacterium]|nr:alpha/beta hydrolase [Pseudomonadota bacterium]
MRLRDSLQRAAARLVIPLLARTSPSTSDLDPAVAAVLRLQRLMRLPDLDTMAPARARAFAEEGMGSLDVDVVAMANVIDTHAAGLPVRIYVPVDVGPNWIVYLHGGGGVIGSIDGSDAVVRLLADRTRCRVASVAYRLGPEHKHPAAIDDACAAFAALAERAGPTARIAVAGDSFGGFLAAHVDLYTRDTGRRRPDLQVLIYPLVDLELAFPSIERNGLGYLLTHKLILWLREHYLHADDDKRAGSPWHRPSLVGACPALVVTAGFDPLVDEGDAYAARLRADGAQVRHRRFDTLVHGFLSMGGAVPAARAAIELMCADLAELLAQPANA